jgi:hypothetical protein
MSNTRPEDNPYLAQNYAKGKGSTNTSYGSDQEPMFGFVPRMVTGTQARKAMVSQSINKVDVFLTTTKEHELNPFTKKPLSSQYKKILEGRKKLPVYAKMDEFFEIVCPSIQPLGRGLSSAFFRHRNPSLLAIHISRSNADFPVSFEITKLLSWSEKQVQGKPLSKR